MIVSSIDIGSNAIRQIIVKINPDSSWTTLDRCRIPIRLGSDVFSNGSITPDTTKRLILAFKLMARLNKKFRVNKCFTYATSAFRDAKNKKTICSVIFKKTKIRIQPISGAFEAKLIMTAVKHNICLNNKHCLLIDIGGGSVELTHLFNNKIPFTKSYKWGMVRMLSEANKQKKNAEQVLEQKLKSSKSDLKLKKFDFAIGTGGNLDCMAKLKLSILKKASNTQITYTELLSLYTKFKKTPAHLRAEKFSLRADRLDIIQPAMYLTLNLMRTHQIKVLKIPGIGLKEGAILYHL